MAKKQPKTIISPKVNQKPKDKKTPQKEKVIKQEPKQISSKSLKTSNPELLLTTKTKRTKVKPLTKPEVKPKSSKSSQFKKIEKRTKKKIANDIKIQEPEPILSIPNLPHSQESSQDSSQNQIINEKLEGVFVDVLEPENSQSLQSSQNFEEFEKLESHQKPEKNGKKMENSLKRAKEDWQFSRVLFTLVFLFIAVSLNTYIFLAGFFSPVPKDYSARIEVVAVEKVVLKPAIKMVEKDSAGLDGAEISNYKISTDKGQFFVDGRASFLAIQLRPGLQCSVRYRQELASNFARSSTPTSPQSSLQNSPQSSSKTSSQNTQSSQSSLASKSTSATKTQENTNWGTLQKLQTLFSDLFANSTNQNQGNSALINQIFEVENCQNPSPNTNNLPKSNSDFKPTL